MPLAADQTFLSGQSPAESTYAWRARDVDGSISSGTLSAVSENEVASRLRSEGRFVISIRQSASGESEPVIQTNESIRFNRNDVIAFFRQLSVMLSAGVSISESLDAIVRQSTDSQRRDFILAIQSEVESGESFSTVLSRRGRQFSLSVVSLIRAAEATGQLDVMTKRAAEHLEKDRRVRGQVKTAITYPAFMAVAGFGIIIALLVLVLPRFAAIYESKAALLPAPTRFLLEFSGFLRGEWYWYLPVLAVLLASASLWARTDSARRQIDSLIFKLPVVRKILLGAIVSRWTRTLSILTSAGVNLVDAVSILRGSTASPSQHDLWDGVEASIRDGRSFASSLEESSLVPPSVAAMVAAGERSGRLSEVLETTADATEEDLDAIVKRATSLIEPAMIVTLGLVVGFIALAMLLPIFGMSQVVSG